MTAYSELKQRARAQNHDVSDPATTDSPAALASGVITGKDVAERAVGRRVIQHVLEGAAAATDYTLDVAAFPSSEYPNGVEVKEIQFRSSAAITESATLFNTHTYVSRDKDGVNNLTSATMTTDTVANAGIGTTVAHKKYNATLSATLANRRVPPDGVLVLVRTHASTGTIEPLGCIVTVVVEAL